MSRAYHYAECAAALEADASGPGAAGLFDQALTNALVGIVATDWPGDEFSSSAKGITKSASGLLALLCQRLPRQPDGRHRLVAKDGTVLDIDVDALQAALAATQPTRHARPAGGRDLLPTEVAALLELDQHPALLTLSGARSDRAFTATERRDREAQADAFDYLMVIGDEEAARRAATVEDYLPFDPKERSIADDPQECPVCSNDTLLVDAVDSFGLGVGAGRCIVCGYRRTEAAMEDLAFDEWMALKADD